MCGFIAQLVEHRTGIAEVTGSNPVEALIFLRLLLSNCLNWKINCDDHSSLKRSYLASVVQAGHHRAQHIDPQSELKRHRRKGINFFKMFPLLH